MYAFTDEANCIGIDTAEFFTYGEDGKNYNNVPLLKRVCGNCTVQDQCLDYALKNEVHGWWAGTTDYNRRQIRKKLNIIPRPLYLDYN